MADKQIRRNAERDQQRLHVPLVNRTDEEEAPPVIVAIVGPEGVGKTTLMRSLIRKFSKHTLTDIRGPVTVVSGENGDGLLPAAGRITDDQASFLTQANDDD